MKRPLQLGITGGIGAGKSLVCKIFKVLGVPVYDADSRAKKLMNSDSILIAQIKKEFGDASYLADGSIDRSYISKLAFESKEKIARLNSLVHPRVAVDYDIWAAEKTEHTYVIKEAALLFESGSFKNLDGILVVSAPEEIRIKRVMKRDPQRSKSDVESIISNQASEKGKIRRADYVIVNDESQLLIPQVLALHEKLIKMSKIEFG